MYLSPPGRCGARLFDQEPEWFIVEPGGDLADGVRNRPYGPQHVGVQEVGLGWARAFLRYLG